MMVAVGSSEPPTDGRGPGSGATSPDQAGTPAPPAPTMASSVASGVPVQTSTSDSADPAAAPSGMHDTGDQVAAYQAAGLIRIGRAPDNDIVLNDLWVSLHHAEVRLSGDSYDVVDKSSTNGIYYNGHRVPSARLSVGDRVSIGRHDFFFDGQKLHEFEDTGPVSLFADDLTVQIKDQVLLDDISFALRQGMLLGVIGPSGCGKSTMLHAVTGLRRATLGRVSYDGRDLYDNYHELRHRIGMVPQDDVVHRQLTVRRALRFAASLRFADDVPRRTRHRRVDEVIDLLGLTQRAGQRIETLSGGQRKRVSVALELLTEPSLLFLDEPTSGLDPALDKEVMQELREQADGGRSVVIVTHSVLHLDLCDRVMVMCVGGRPGYFGPPDQLLAFFGSEDYADVFVKVTREPEHWARRFRDSDHYRKYISEAAQEASAVTPLQQMQALTAHAGPAAGVAGSGVNGSGESGVNGSGESGAGSGDGGVRHGGRKVLTTALGGLPLRVRALHPAQPIRQFLTLCLRMINVVAADRGYAMFLLGLPLALALLTHSVPGTKGLGPDRSITLEAQRLLVVLIVGASFMGIAVSIREIVSEATIYRRERAVALSPGAYLASKLVVFGIIVSVQSALFVYLSLLGRPKPSQPLIWKSYPLGEIMIPVALVAIISVVLGLLVSVLARTVEQTTPVLVVAVMAQLVLSGGLFALKGQKPLEQIAWFAPTRWGYSAGASTVDLTRMVPLKEFQDPLWAHTVGSWWRAVVLLVVQLIALIAAARLAMRRLEPNRQK
jgi:ABC transport system ATP-binding/permease protein